MAELHLLSPRGFIAGAAAAGIKTKRGALDVGVLACSAKQPASAAGMFTTNSVFAAPVKVGRKHLRATGGQVRAAVVNAGNANACTGRQGERDALKMCSVAAKLLDCDPADVIPSSTGIIGHLLPMPKIESGIREAATSLGDSAEHAALFADAILTTDTRRKVAAATVRIGGQTVTIAGVCKGAGMIGPRMALGGVAVSLASARQSRSAFAGSKSSPIPARGSHATLLAFLTTDARLPSAVLGKLLAGATETSFNAVTIDDHTSTNDTALLLASGASGVSPARSSADLRKFAAALNEVCASLAYQIAADGEGATKVVEVAVSGAADVAEANRIARAIANSPLVKCAMNGNDPNWGRIVSAAGYAGRAFNPDRCTLRLQGKMLYRAGRPLKFDAVALSKSLAADRVLVELNCGVGRASATVWTCDFSKEYVAINADYHT